jgi:hypothetical protein
MGDRTRGYLNNSERSRFGYVVRWPNHPLALVPTRQARSRHDVQSARERLRVVAYLRTVAHDVDAVREYLAPTVTRTMPIVPIWGNR